MITSEQIIEMNKNVRSVLDYFAKQGLTDTLIVGSCALANCGIPLSRPPYDVDLELRCKEGDNTENILKALSDLCENSFYKTKEEYPEQSGFEHKPYIFTLHTENSCITVNVWVVREFTHKQVVCINGVLFATAYSVLKKKAAYKRNKDIKEISYITKKILDLI